MHQQLGQFLLLVLGLGLSWWALTEGDHQAWWFGAAVVIALAFWLVKQGARIHLRWLRLPGFALFFVSQSWQGGWDVAKRALFNPRGFESGYLDYSLKLAPGWQRDTWLAMVGLFPGTLSVAIQGGQARVHVLDLAMPVEPGLVALEQYLMSLAPNEACL